MLSLRTAPLARVASIVFLVACSSTATPGSSDGGGGGGTDGGAGGDLDSSTSGSCATTNVSDGPTADQTIAAGATTVICYYAQPSEGYCRKITDATTIGNYVTSKDKGAIGCKDAVILSGPECPTKNAVGKCDANSIDAQRVYYKCSKFADPKAHCAQITGTFTAL